MVYGAVLYFLNDAFSLLLPLRLNSQLACMARSGKRGIVLEDGRIVEALAPVVVSASRATDIPAFYARWFFHRLKVGYSAWRNPFNGVRSYVSYHDTRFIVFWSKNPRPLLEFLPELEARGIGCYLQYSLNDYEKERLEVGVPRIAQRIETFRQFSQRLGKEGVIWRFDPLILTESIGIGELLKRVEAIGNQLHLFTRKLVFSFADIAGYRKVQSNLARSGIPYREWTTREMEEFAARLAELNSRNGWNLQLATCAEAIDLASYGIAHNRCIDTDLIVRLAYSDAALMQHLGIRIETAPPGNLFGLNPLPQGAILLPDGSYYQSVHRKDRGQRLLCDCMVAKDIGEYNTCPHFCEYCYANGGKEAVAENWNRYRAKPLGETITGE